MDDFNTLNAAFYSHEYSKFPDKLITLHHFKDADDSVASLINEINDLKARGLNDLANKKSTEYADILKPYIIDSEVIRTNEEEIYNTQVMAKQKHQCVYTQEDIPKIWCTDDIWIVVRRNK